MKYLLLVIVYLTLQTSAFAGISRSIYPILPPTPTTIACPTLPTSFKGHHTIWMNNAWWSISVATLDQNAAVQMNGGDSYRYTANSVGYLDLFKQYILQCDGFLTIDGEIYPFTVKNSLNSYSKCDAIGSAEDKTLGFTCT